MNVGRGFERKIKGTSDMKQETVKQGGTSTGEFGEVSKER